MKMLPELGIFIPPMGRLLRRSFVYTHQPGVRR